ncbi:uncharacterized protein LOC112679838 isoform X2 [Sipha flava]|uniref:Uncharacterized protein LOC112679838 isoform X2 n=3 Tax=Sipha flava TaxID=143950 RepID=A0A8B8F4C6_9HEMI|nr:uncharacterized protein LOC112679838 isoform X2 [Sipha flava]
MRKVQYQQNRRCQLSNNMDELNSVKNIECNNRTQSNLDIKPGLLIINSYVNQFNPDLKAEQLEIKEVVDKQNSLISSMLKENEELSNLLNESEVQDMFTSIKHCHGQLIELKKKLMFLHKKTISLERRANVLRVAKQREALQREHLKESMLVREQELISKQS